MACILLFPFTKSKDQKMKYNYLVPKGVKDSTPHVNQPLAKDSPA